MPVKCSPQPYTLCVLLTHDDDDDEVQLIPLTAEGNRLLA